MLDLGAGSWAADLDLDLARFGFVRGLDLGSLALALDLWRALDLECWAWFAPLGRGLDLALV